LRGRPPEKTGLAPLPGARYNLFMDIVKIQTSLILEKIISFQTLIFLSAVVFVLLAIVLACQKTIKRYKKENAELKSNNNSSHKKENIQSVKVKTGTRRPYFLREGDSFNFYIGEHAGGKLMSGIQNAKKSIKILSPYLSVSEINELCAKSSGGIEDIAIITSASYDNLKKLWQVDALKKLIGSAKKENGEYEYSAIFKSVFFKADFFHAKLYIIDDEIAFAGSINFTYKGVEKSHETCFTIKDTDTVKGLIEYYDGLFSTNFYKWNITELGKKIYTFYWKKTTDEKNADFNDPAPM
jgi:phosphatidylserine/phosphatidylglycerophosphate/cardiolipin synthase-like enzyme